MIALYYVIASLLILPFVQSFNPQFSLKTGIFSRNALYMKHEQLGRVTMYKKTGCPFCVKATDLLEKKYELEVTFVDIESDDKDQKLQQMRTFSGGRNTVPQIFFNSEHLGGNDDVQKLDADGALAAKVEAVRKTGVSMMMDHWYHPWY